MPPLKQINEWSWIMESQGDSHLLILTLFAALQADQYFVLPTVLYVLILT